MRSMQRTVCALTVGTVLLLAGLLVGQTQGQQRDRADKPDALRAALEAVPQVISKSERLGRRLLAGLSDESLPDDVRGRCARALGKLRYLPAIPKLIELNHLLILDEDERNRITAEVNVLIFPCDLALGDYRELAVPSIAEAYLKEKDEGRASSLACALYRGNIQTTRVYLEGLLLESPDHRAKRRLFDDVGQFQQKDFEDRRDVDSYPSVFGRTRR